MLELIQYATSGFWVFIGVYLILVVALYAMSNVVIKIFTRILRFLMISFRGWPPAHLDADGDWKPYVPQKEDKADKK